jgi:2-aminoethylphosphonate transport system ATP-binding protein
VTASVAFSGAEVSAAAKAATGSGVAFDKVSAPYRGAVVLKPLTMSVAAGEILAMIGPSGSGKTTALRAVAGFVRPAAGRILIGGTDVTNLPPYERGLAMVVQNYALFPHMRVSRERRVRTQCPWSRQGPHRRARRGLAAHRRHGEIR